MRHGERRSTGFLTPHAWSLTPCPLRPTPSMTFSLKLTTAVCLKKTPVLVGLDPRLELIPPSLRLGLKPAVLLERFCCDVIDVVAPLVPAVKPQAAFFEQYGPDGMAALGAVIRYAREKGLLVVFDGKRNDIADTAEAYASGILGEPSAWGADALTISPYLGGDSIDPFARTAVERQAGVFVLVKTSNPGGTMFQNLCAQDKPVYCHVAEYVQSLALKTKADGEHYGQIGSVVGATWPSQLAELRKIMPNAWFLVPGFGTQGGSASDVAAAFDSDGLGAIVNNSRGIIFAHTLDRFQRYGEMNWQRAVEAAAREMIDLLRAETTAGKL